MYVYLLFLYLYRVINKMFYLLYILDGHWKMCHCTGLIQYNTLNNGWFVSLFKHFTHKLCLAYFLDIFGSITNGPPRCQKFVPTPYRVHWVLINLLIFWPPLWSEPKWRSSTFRQDKLAQPFSIAQIHCLPCGSFPTTVMMQGRAVMAEGNLPHCPPQFVRVCL